MLLHVLLAAAFLTTASAQSPNSAFRALFAAGKSSQGAALVEIRGDRGEPQPASWTFLYADDKARGGVREVVVGASGVESVRTPLSGFAGFGTRPKVALNRLAVDSDRAFEIANAAAVRAKIPFHWMSYKLASRPSGHPVWQLVLINADGVAAGTLEISAETGQILSGVGAPAMGVDTEAGHAQPSATP